MISILFVVLVAMGCGFVESRPACPPFWVPFQESCYRAFGTKLNWDDASNQCHSHFNEFQVAHLVSIQSEAEHLFVYDLWKSTTGNMVAQYDVTFWMGLNDKDQEGNWVWSGTDEAVTYTRWKTGQPDNSGGEDCGHSSNVDPMSPTWNDWGCENEVYYVCEMPQSK